MPRSASQRASSSQTEEPPLTEFELTERSGQLFRSRDLQGQVWVGSFFFTSCGSNCRMLNMKVAQLQREFGSRGVRFVSISCDPQVDTPRVMSQYAEMFNADPHQWLFLTGDLDYAKRIGQDMLRVSVDRRSHVDQLVVIDAKGTSRGAFLALQDDQFQRLRALLEELVSGVADAASVRTK
jgi:cytochrome oxidase Cu insertion factor (SCO1/SenC/PrrC family)